jgi:hypothetical protein
MKTLFHILLTLLLCCFEDVGAQDTTRLLRHISRDTVIVTLQQDSFPFSKEEYNLLIDHFPKLFYKEYPAHPDLLYATLPAAITGDNGNRFLPFISEAGKDDYYRLYAHFLAQRNGVEKYAEQRKLLNLLFDAINNLQDQLHCHGAYYAHRRARIPGYAEYAVYQYSLYENNGVKRFAIGPQKKHYIALLRQMVTDEMKVDDDLVDCATGRKKSLEDLADLIGKLITDAFYLRQALAFQYATYGD